MIDFAAALSMSPPVAAILSLMSFMLMSCCYPISSRPFSKA